MNQIEVIGLGAGDIDQLPLGIYKKLTTSQKPIFVRTVDHPVIQTLEQEGVTFKGYDSVYEAHAEFGDVYQAIVEDLLHQAKSDSLIYAVPGHPMLAEKTVQLLEDQTEVNVTIVGGQSYLDDLFTALRMDPIEGFQFVDATSFSRFELNYLQHIVFCQVYDSFVASEVKLALLEDLNPEHPITIVDAVGSNQEKILRVPLVELDQTVSLSNLTSIYVPPVKREQLPHQFFRLREVIAQLRGPNGCPWDKEQTHESLRNYLLEEAYEFIEAVDDLDDDGMIEELGDVLLQVMLHSQIGEDEGYFTVDDVIESITEKMIRRHPHVFGDTVASSSEKVVQNWDEIKRAEKTERTSLMDAVPKHMSGLLEAEQIQKQAAKVGFDWQDPEPMWEKIKEEMEEVKQAIATQDEKEIEKEFGDVLFAIVNLTRYYKINPELAVKQTNRKFKQRFTFMEQEIKKNNEQLSELTLERLDQYWDKAKQAERKEGNS
ncbi:nucleoside triphosphate pyrophosphohydrolase (plasmid) [Radiobacillus kanasensis]|uniref:nucleoside triphosphate pyrophosphohydrolase n=1 Tax=Radiobacillus kanasensis TaxID=2844358 RepID=UPI001E361B9F|nr:nucleoside triphosphate pyrophosphohydrolase [Radiobacillus kanasensis]UFU01476.1 nucleoside triphosphate pyrophosphohydrolase [Radiobacillus kanasensis]